MEQNVWEMHVVDEDSSKVYKIFEDTKLELHKVWQNTRVKYCDKEIEFLTTDNKSHKIKIGDICDFNNTNTKQEVIDEH